MNRYIFICLIFILSCDTYNPKEKKRVKESKGDGGLSGKSSLQDTLTDIQELHFRNYYMQVTTKYLNDSIEDEPKFNPVILRQEITFSHGDTIKCLVESPSNHLKRKLASGKTAEVLDNVIYKIGVIKGKNGSIFYVEGTGACNACNELKMFFTLEGDNIYLFYGSTARTIKIIGDPEKIYTRFKISEKSPVDSKNLQNVKYFY